MPELFAYQRAGVEFLRRGDGLLADGMGAGKMVQALMAMDPRGVTIVVCPKKVHQQWLDQAAVWRPDLTVIDGAQDTSCPLHASADTGTVFRHGSVAVVWVHALANGNHYAGRFPGPLTVVLDEPHNHRTWTSKWVQRIGSWTRFATRVWGLDGTPCYNTVDGIWPILCMLRLGKRFGYERVIAEARNARLRDKLCESGVMLARDLADVEDQVRIPPLERRICTVPWIPVDGAGLSASKLRQRNGRVKAANMRTWMQAGVVDVPLSGPGLLWCFHVDVAGALRNTMVGAGLRVGCVTGATSRKVCAKAFADFQSSDLDWLVLTYASNAGPTLTRALHSVVIELPWEPKALAQATHRMWRIGQTEITRETIVQFDHWSDEHVGDLVGFKGRDIAHAGF